MRLRRRRRYRRRDLGLVTPWWEIAPVVTAAAITVVATVAWVWSWSQACG